MKQIFIKLLIAQLLLTFLGCSIFNGSVDENNISKISSGMSKEQVLKLLCEPDYRNNKTPDIGCYGCPKWEWSLAPDTNMEIWSYVLENKTIDIYFLNGSDRVKDTFIHYKYVVY